MSACRANCLALVNHEWRRLEQETRHNLQPTSLTLDAEQCNSSFITWHVGQKLMHLEVDASEIRASGLRSLQLAFSRAPALQSLYFSPPVFISEEDSARHQLPILGCLTQLTELRLHSWEYRPEDVQHVAALSALSNLKVRTLCCWLVEEAVDMQHQK